MEDSRASANPAELEDQSVTCQLDVPYWYRRVYALCHSRLISAADAEDATQETFVRGLARVGELRSPEAIGGWLRQIAHHVCIDMIRRNKVRETSPTDVDLVAGDTRTDCVAEEDQRRHLVGLIYDLPEQLRETILLHYYDNMTYDEMAKWLHVARSTVNERLGKARQLLKQRLVSTEHAP